MLSHPLLSPAFLSQFSDFTLYITFKAYYPLLFTFILLPSFFVLKSRIYCILTVVVPFPSCYPLEKPVEWVGRKISG